MGTRPAEPCSVGKATTRVAREMTALTAEQVSVFLAAARGDRLEALYVVAVTTGMRQGELFALRWANIDLVGATTSRSHGDGRSGAPPAPGRTACGAPARGNVLD